MFVAVNQNRKKRFAFDKDKETLRILSKAKELYCPNCKKKVFFHGGPKRIHHFNHAPHMLKLAVSLPSTYFWKGFLLCQLPRCLQLNTNVLF